jgi:hypothetical protein
MTAWPAARPVRAARSWCTHFKTAAGPGA